MFRHYALSSYALTRALLTAGEPRQDAEYLVIVTDDASLIVVPPLELALRRREAGRSPEGYRWTPATGFERKAPVRQAVRTSS